jgi:phage baseplate assembly protein gpV
VGGDKSETVDGSWNIEVTGSATIKAPLITLDGEVSVTGNLTANGDISDAGGAKSMSGMREVHNSHTHQENGDGGGVTDPPTQGM